MRIVSLNMYRDHLKTTDSVADDQVFAFDVPCRRPRWVGSRFNEFCWFTFKLGKFFDTLNGNLYNPVSVIFGKRKEYAYHGLFETNKSSNLYTC